MLDRDHEIAYASTRPCEFHGDKFQRAALPPYSGPTLQRHRVAAGARMGSYKSQIFFCLNIAFALLAIVLLALHMVNVEGALTGSQMMPLKGIEATARR